MVLILLEKVIAQVIIIDLILLSTQAQRHVLYNSSCKNLYKILMVITLLESYCLFMESFDKNRIGFTKEEAVKDPLYMEKGRRDLVDLTVQAINYFFLVGFYLSTIQIILCKYFTVSSYGQVSFQI